MAIQRRAQRRQPGCGIWGGIDQAGHRHPAIAYALSLQGGSDVAVQPGHLRQLQHAVAAQPDGVPKAAFMHLFAHRLAAEDKAFHAKKCSVRGKIDLHPAVQDKTVEENCLLRQVVE